ncbi:MAG: hypothetical protein KF809_04555 [Chloroflexi bacterium]|nr:hypothetical protein [Chloroflexota bacterium]
MWDFDEGAVHRPLCAFCGSEITGDPDDDLRHPSGPMCGACYRQLEFDHELMEMGEEDLW